jgi:glycosyltransferase involved in cell wall biosynthesis
MMKILALTTLYPSPWLPHRASFNRQQFAALAAQHQVHVIAPVSWTDAWRSRLAASGSRLQLRDGMTIEHPPFYFTPGCLRHRHGEFYLLSVRRCFDRAVEAFAPDVVLAAWAYPDTWAAAELCRKYNLPLVAKVHGSDVLLPAKGSRRLSQTADALRGCDAVIAVSRQLAGAVCDLGVSSDRVHTVYNGVDTRTFAPSERDRERPSHRRCRLLYVGNLVEVKGLDVLISACGLLRDRGVDFECNLIGQGPLRGRLAQQITELSLGERVCLLPPRPHHALAEAYRDADVFVLPSRSEGVPNVVLEAIACGTPVVATRVGGIPEVLDERFLVDPDNADALAGAIARQLQSPETSDHRALSWRQSAEALAGVLRSTLSKRRSAAA